MGAVPLYAAKWSLSAKRPTSPVIPTAMAATTGPTPKILARRRPGGGHHGGQALPQLF